MRGQVLDLRDAVIEIEARVGSDLAVDARCEMAHVHGSSQAAVEVEELADDSGSEA